MTIRLSLALIAFLAPVFAAPDEATPPGRLRRLTHSQYNNTVRDLLGDQTRPADQFPPEDFLNGFKNQSRAQEISPLLAEAYNTAAEKLARNAVAGGEDSNHLIPCKPKSTRDSACANTFVRSFGGKAFRRPLSDAEATRYTALSLRENQFLRGAQLVVEAMMQSPKFLFHLETASYKAASDLSYFLWDTMPDDELFRVASAGELSTETGVRRQAARLLKDPKAKQALDEFTSQWLRFDQVWNTVKNRGLYPPFNMPTATPISED